VVAHRGRFYDCGAPARYLQANLDVAGAASVVGEGADVDGSIDGCVIWSGARVAADERLHRAIRTPSRTVLVR
jgi:hypothetical protein